MKIRALKSFEGIKDIERGVYPKEGDVWEVDEERANFLKSHGVIEFVEDEVTEEVVQAVANAIVEEAETPQQKQQLIQVIQSRMR